MPAHQRRSRGQIDEIRQTDNVLHIQNQQNVLPYVTWRQSETVDQLLMSGCLRPSRMSIFQSIRQVSLDKTWRDTTFVAIFVISKTSVLFYSPNTQGISCGTWGCQESLTTAGTNLTDDVSTDGMSIYRVCTMQMVLTRDFSNW